MIGTTHQRNLCSPVLPMYPALLFIILSDIPKRRDGITGRTLETENHNITTNRFEGTRRDRVPTDTSKSSKPWPRWPSRWSLGYIINQYKWSVTHEVNKLIDIWTYTLPYNDRFKRQSRYHDHIIRNNDEYDRIKQYIHTNPVHRKKDTFYS